MKGVYIFVVILLQLNIIAAQDFTELCRLFKNGTIIASASSKNAYTVCDGDIGITYTCNEPQVFDSSKKSCATSFAEVVDNPCQGAKDSTWVADPQSCQSYYYCQNSVAWSGICPDGYHFDASKQMCNYASESSCFIVPNFCNYVPKSTRFVNENVCNRYYECSGSGNPSNKACSGKLYYNRATETCVDSKTVLDCRAHPYPSNVCSKDGLVSDAATCRGYFECRNLLGVKDEAPKWYQCPEGTFFSAADQACRPPKDVYCKYNRCEGRGTMLVTSSSNDCHNFIECVNNLEVAEYSCPLDTFFDERLQSCSQKVIYDACCDNMK